MRRRLRIRRIAKWAGLALCVLLALAFAATPLWYFGWQSRTWSVVVMSGSVHLIGLELIGAKGYTGGMPQWQFNRNLYTPAQWTSQLSGWVSIEASSEETTTMRTLAGTTRPIKTHKPSYIILPIWIPFLLLLVPTALLWWHDRRYRFPSGHCNKCGYDLTGNVSGRCPEGGTEINPRESRRAARVEPRRGD